jgi:glycosyltransferase involved in cell wall biosynthesis
MTAPDNPVVSIIVPARNEEISLGACLESLAGQSGIRLEIIVVDDDSTDRTAEIARSFPGLHVIPAGPLPDNWNGKNNAMAAGAKIAKGKWLLFTDADTVHKAGSLAHAVAEAEQHGASLLSYSPEQEVHGFWEMAVMPVIFAELATTYPPQAVNDPTSPIAAANGQYLMITREAYKAVGGHPKIAGDLLEDVALARLVKSSGRKIFFRYGGDAVRTRMYRGFAQMKEGWTKNLALLFPSPRSLAILRSAEFLLITGNVVTAVWAGLSGRHNLALQTFLLTIILAGWFWMRIRKAHFSTPANLVALFGLPVFSYLLFQSASSKGAHRLVWKGRRYSITPAHTEEPIALPNPQS